MIFDVLDISTLSDVSVSNLQSKLNKVIRKTKNNPYKIMFPCLGSLDSIELLMFTDASYANLSDRVSSAGGHLIFIRGKMTKPVPFLGQLRNKKIVKSTLAAKASSLVERFGVCYYMRSILQEIVNLETKQSIPFKCYTDNESLCQRIFILQN